MMSLRCDGLPILAGLALLMLPMTGLSAAETPVTPSPQAPSVEVVSTSGTVPTTAAAPDTTLKAWVRALRTNDLMALFQALPQQSRADLTQVWNVQSITPDAAGDRQITGALGLLLAPNSVDVLVARFGPDLAAINVQDLVTGLQQAGSFLALMGSQGKPPGAGPSMDFPALQSVVNDIATWLPGAGLTDAAKLRTAIEHVVLGAKTVNLQNAGELRALKADDVIRKLGPVLSELKQILLLYGLDANGLLDSVTFTVLEGSSDQRHINVAFSAFGHPHTIPVTVILKNDAWQLAEGTDSPFAPLSQLLMMGMMNMAGSDALAPAHGPAPRAAPATNVEPAPTQPPL